MRRLLAMAIVLLILLLAGLGVAWVMVFSKDQPKNAVLPTEPLPEVTVLVVPEPSKIRQMKLSGRVLQTHARLVRTEVGGAVQRVFAKEGDYLKIGKPLVQLDDTAVRMAYQHAQIQLGFAQARFQMALMGSPSPIPEAAGSRASDITLEPGKVRVTGYQESRDAVDSTPPEMPETALMPSSSNLPSAQKAMEEVQGQLEALDKLMGMYRIVMPQAGRIARLPVTPNQMLAPGDTVAELKTQARPQIMVKLTAETLATQKQGQAVLVRIPGSLTTLSAQGRIETLQADAKTPSIGWALVELTQGNLSALKPGKTVDVFFEVPGEGSLWIPAEAVQFIGDSSSVFVVAKSEGASRLLQRAVLVGKVAGADMEIIEGLSPGETVVLPGEQQLEHQQRVYVRAVRRHP